MASTESRAAKWVRICSSVQTAAMLEIRPAEVTTFFAHTAHKVDSARIDEQYGEDQIVGRILHGNILRHLEQFVELGGEFGPCGILTLFSRQGI
jgi:hypothetical protein